MRRSKKWAAVVEGLEFRRLLATITVTSTADTITPNDGAVTLREAITAINAGNDLGDPDITAQNPAATNAFGTKDTINFNISGSGVQTIKPTSALPNLTNTVTINGYSQTGAASATDSAAATILIELDGENAGAMVNGLSIAAPNVTIEGLAINRFDANGISTEMGFDTGDSVFRGNYIGVSADGATAEGNGNCGIDEGGGVNDTIGGTNAADRNVISGNKNAGMYIHPPPGGEGSNTDGVVVEGNYIGTDATGLKAVANTNDGILGFGTNSNTIGGSDAGAGNVITGNGTNGVELDDVEDYVVAGNEIGTTVFQPLGDTPVGNGNAGVLIHNGALNNTIGGTDPGARNIIGDNLVGVQIDGTSTGPDTRKNVVEGNYIGLNDQGLFAESNDTGVLIDVGAQDNTIGGTATGAGNVISGNLPNVEILGGSGSGGQAGTNETTGNVVEGNSIGIDSRGLFPVLFFLPNGFNGAFPVGAFEGVYVGGTATDNVIGGTTAAARNVISGNYDRGIMFDGAPGNIAEGNYIGTDVTGSVAVPNQGGGVLLYGASNDVIGGVNPGAGNLISGNGQDRKGSGVQLAGGSGNVVAGNLIGTDATGLAPLGNTGDGVQIGDDSSGNVIGGSVAAAKNVIAYNGGAGVGIVQNSALANPPSVGTPFSRNDVIRLNSIYSNAGLGIDLNDDGITLNSSAGGGANSDSGSNNLQNFPTLNSAVSGGSSTTITGQLDSTPDSSFLIDFYVNMVTSDSGLVVQGKTFVGTAGAATDSNGHASLNVTLPISIAAGSYLTATATTVATAPYGDTSEFAPPIDITSSGGTGGGTVTPPTPPTISIGDVSKNEGNSGTTSFTFTITRSGDLSGASSVKFATADGTATVADNDYQPQSNTIGFDPGQATKTVTILVNGDTKHEADETFVVNLSNATGATIADAQATGTIINDDASPPPPPASGTVTVVTDPIDSTKTALDVVGTSNADTITVTKSGSSQGKAVVKINGVNKGTFSFTGIILVYGNAGNDNISIDSGITRSAWIWGGDNNDTVNGGGGADMIFGQAGNDSLNGNAGRDILIGGDGTDKLSGGGGDDVLIAGDFKTTPSMSQLASIQKEWTRTDKNYTYRVNHLTTGGGFNTIKLNSSTLFSSATLKDSLTGGADSDLFFAATSGDKIIDKAAGETAVNVG